jgi:molybdopterin/thiamine biosynthesis adenylyltransferase
MQTILKYYYKDDAIVNAIQEITSDDIVIKSLDNSKPFMNVNARNFVLQTDNKSNVELNLKGETAKIIMSENARIKALVTVTDFTDM